MDEWNGHVIDLNFLSHEEVIRESLLWDIEEYQLENGPYIGQLHVIHTSHIQLAYTFNSTGTFQKGKTPKNAYLFCDSESDGLLTHNGLRFDTDELIVLDDNDEIDYTASDAADIITIAVEKDFFETEFKDYFNESFKYDQVNKRIQLKENTVSDFRSTARETLAGLMTQGKKLQSDPLFHGKVEHNILQILFQNLDRSRQHKKTFQGDIDANKVRQYIELNYKDQITLEELCSSEKFSDRTIRSSFNRLFGFSPKQYLKQYRLGKTHFALIRSNPTSTTVGEVAYDNGFTHMGRFNDQYKTMFGETPYTTLKKPLLPPNAETENR